MGLLYRILGLILLLIGGYVGYIIYTGNLTIWINSTFLKAIGGLLLLGIGLLSLGLMGIGFKFFIGNHPINDKKKEFEEESKILQEQKEIKKQKLEQQVQARIKREQIEKEEKELDKQEEIKRINLLPKCPSCNEPLDHINNTFTKTLKDKQISNIKIIHKEFEFYTHIGDITKINTITCNSCHNSFEEESFEKSASKKIKAKCPNCESFETKFTQKEYLDDEGDIMEYSIKCHCNDCKWDWDAVQLENQLIEQKERDYKIEQAKTQKYKLDQEELKQKELKLKKKELEDKERKLENEKIILEQNKISSQSNFSNNQNSTKPKVKNGMIVKYRIKTIGTDQSEIVPAGTESEARRIIKAKYPTMDVHIISAMYNYE